MTLRLSTVVVSVLIAGLIGWIGCGSRGGPSRPRVMEDGYVYVRNDTSEILGVRYFNDEMRETVEVEVPARAEQMNVSQVKLEGASKVTFSISRPIIHEDTGEQVSQRFEVEVEIDGNQTIWIKEISGGTRGATLFDCEIITTQET